MTSVMSYQYWHYTGFTARQLRFNIIIGHLLCCLHCFEGFTSGLLTVQFSVKGAYVCPRRGKIGDGNSWVEGNTFAQSGRSGGSQTFKRAYCCSFHSGFDCLCFDLVLGRPCCAVLSSHNLCHRWNTTVEKNTDRVSVSLHWAIFSPRTVSMKHLIY